MFDLKSTEMKKNMAEFSSKYDELKKEKNAIEEKNNREIDQLKKNLAELNKEKNTIEEKNNHEIDQLKKKLADLSTEVIFKRYNFLNNLIKIYFYEFYILAFTDSSDFR